MKRYKEANEGIHAPEEAKEKAARAAASRGYPRWAGAVAAVLAVAVIGGAAMWPKAGPAAHSGDGPAPFSADGPEGRSVPDNPEEYPGHGGGTHKALALASAEYPEMVQYPRDEDYGTDWSDLDTDALYADRAAWRESVNALRSGTDYSGLLDGFLTDSTAQFLTGAGEENRVYSPLNVYMALSMLAETTGGNSRQQLLDLLDADSIEGLRSQTQALWKDNYRDDGVVTSILANSLWLREDMTYSQKTLDALAENYYASSFAGEMGSGEYDAALRDWLNEQTKGLLAEQAAGLEFDPETVLALASTIYFKAAWDSGFSPEGTKTDVFHAPGGDIDADFMRKTIWGGVYYWGGHFAAVELGFQNGGEMWLLLPDEGHTVDGLLESGEAMEFLLADKSGYYDEEKDEYVETWPGQKNLIINLSMPKFDVSSDLNLIEGLKALGVTDVFDDRVSNFDPLGASTDDPLYVGMAQHAACVTVDEDGCEAAAYTILDIWPGANAPPDEEVEFTLDRPFLFAITGDSGLPLFTGVVNQPNG